MAEITLTEHEEAVLFAEFLDKLQDMGKITLFSHIPHETFTKNWGTKRRNRLEGVKRGVPDYIIITDKKVLFVELKRKKKSNVSEDQKVWNEHLQFKQTAAYIARGFDEAVSFVNDNL